MGFSRSLTTVGISNLDPEAACESGTEIGQVSSSESPKRENLLFRESLGKQINYANQKGKEQTANK